MATSHILFICLLLILPVLSQEPPTSRQAFSQIRPQISGCVSHDMNTFRCRWNVGVFQNLTEPRDLRIFYYINDRNISPKEWVECPRYADRTDECFFNESYTKVWMTYSVQLRSGDQDILYDEVIFTVEDIVEPDPPIALNWTLLNVGLTGSHFDIMLSWEPPHSADVSMGWMTLQYEVQYREVNSTLWRTVDLEKGMQRSLYGLRTNTDNEVRVRCKTLASRNFGEFSDSIFIHIPTKESRLPGTVLLVFAALGFAVILMLVIYSQQQKLMVILLPPIPGPKIKGIDPELLKKGKLAELTSILGGIPDLRPELYSDDPWVEFIELDMEEPNDRLTVLDTQCLMDHCASSDCPPITIGFRDDDSGRASCCDPDLPDLEASPFHSLLSNTSRALEPSSLASTKASSPVQTPNTEDSPWAAPGREDLYTQVNEVRPTGEVLLTPEEQRKVEENAEKDEKEKEKKKKRKEFQLLLVNADVGGYTSELDAGKMSARLPTGRASQPAPTEDSSLVQGQPFGEYQSLYFEAERPPIPPASPVSSLPPVSAYTMVEGVDRQNSLLLKPGPTPAPQPVLTKLPLPTPTPEGYLTPDLLGNITP
ncbi:growth hormone receptor b isoform X1 [Salvelinus sp. IW2-2015]|uniref:growth hormone receptor b isoform X1 n=2 Tax=Salvelinus sp. IW2-2015 TaxID=2691554 RepID=UPI000CDFE798|nr:growth hormone receptor isoform X1 [Salvelinus alpinus]XP_023839853.1 growth hormone receptor isoform X1 [Salvelinus alpinus]